MSAYGKRENWKEARNLLRRMWGSGAPDVTSYNVCIKACGDAGQWEEALEVLGEMARVGVTPDAVTYNAAIAACGKGGQG